MEPNTRSALGRGVLLLAAAGTLCMAVVQAAMPFSRGLLRAFDGPEEWSTPLLYASSFAVAALLCVVALYPLSGAGIIRRLPFLRVVLAVVGAGLVWRGLPLPGEIAGAFGSGPMAETWSWGGLISSAGTLVIGLGYLTGLVFSWRALSRGRSGRVEQVSRHV